MRTILLLLSLCFYLPTTVSAQGCTNNFVNFSIAFTSDPQYPWKNPVTQSKSKSESYRQIAQQYDDINRLRNYTHTLENDYPLVATIINGDLTAYGHGNEFKKYKELISRIEIPVFPGLGNHDYANNIRYGPNGNGCVNNGCARKMVVYMSDWIKENAQCLDNYDVIDNSYSFKGRKRTNIDGSLSYSYNIGNVHFIQLQNFPFYTVYFQAQSNPTSEEYFINIKSSYEWLKLDLQKARDEGKVIIVNLHIYDFYDTDIIDPKELPYQWKGKNWIKDSDQMSCFQNLMVKYRVSALFTGHKHNLCGFTESIKCEPNHNYSVPVFFCGSASYQQYLLAQINTESSSMQVIRRYDPDFNLESSGIYKYDMTEKKNIVIPLYSGTDVVDSAFCDACDRP